jgi:hypothetical protein
MAVSTGYPDIKISPLLTTLARGYHNGQLIGTEIFPIVSVDLLSAQIPLFGKNDMTLYDTRRALRAKSNVIGEGDVQTTTYQCREYDAVVELDYLERDHASFDRKKASIESATRAIALGREAQMANLLFNLDSYDDTNKATLTAGTYLDIDDTDVIKYLYENVNEKVRSQIGEYPNTYVIPAGVYRFLRSQASIKKYFALGTTPLLTTDFLAQLLGVDRILIANANTLNTDGSFKPIWGNGIWAGYIKPAQALNSTPYEPAFGYTLQLKGNPYADEFTKDGKVDCYRATDNYDIKIVGKDAGFYLKNPIDPTKF